MEITVHRNRELSFGFKMSLGCVVLDSPARPQLSPFSEGYISG